MAQCDQCPKKLFMLDIEIFSMELHVKPFVLIKCTKYGNIDGCGEAHAKISSAKMEQRNYPENIKLVRHLQL